MNLSVFLKHLQQDAPDIVMLGGPSRPSALNQWAIIGTGIKQQITLNPNETPDEIFERLQQALKNTRQWPNKKQRHNLPFAGGLVMALGYEFYRYCDTAFDFKQTPLETDHWPTVLAQECEDWVICNLATQEIVVLSDNPQRSAQIQRHWEASFNKKCEDFKAPPNTPSEDNYEDNYLDTWETSLDEVSFSKKVDGIKTAITKGELYQANLSMRFTKPVSVNPLDVLETLCQKNPSPFSGYWQNNRNVLISCSPERLFNLRNNIVETRPIAGTRSRGEEAELLNNPKERAEHLMLVDLERNDLGRVCTPGSVQVNELLTLEAYSHVTHLVSNIQGQLEKNKTVWDVIRATFPGGTITGCPKIRCIEVLETLEPQPRGFYTGSLGYIDALTGDADFNILIRSMLLTPISKTSLVYNARIQAGAGIVADSIGIYEHRESLKKAHALLGALYACEHRPTLTAAIGK